MALSAFYRIVDKGQHREATRYQLECRIGTSGPFEVVGQFPTVELANYEASRHYEDYKRIHNVVIVSEFEKHI